MDYLIGQKIIEIEIDDNFIKMVLEEKNGDINIVTISLNVKINTELELLQVKASMKDKIDK